MAESGFVPAPKGQPSPPLGVENVVGFAPLAAMAVPLGSLALAGVNPTPAALSAAPLSNVSLSGLLPPPLAQPSPPLGSLTLSGLVPTTFAQQVVNVPPGSLGFAGMAPNRSSIIDDSFETGIGWTWYPSSDPNATVSQTRDATHVQSSANALHLAVTSTTFPATNPLYEYGYDIPVSPGSIDSSDFLY